MRRASLYNTFSASLLLVCSAWLSSCVSQIPLTKEKPVNNSTYQVIFAFAVFLNLFFIIEMKSFSNYYPRLLIKFF